MFSLSVIFNKFLVRDPHYHKNIVDNYYIFGFIVIYLPHNLLKSHYFYILDQFSWN
jgi:hypothetical protein